MELITKGIPVLCLIVWLFALPRDRFANLIMAGLIVSLVADLVLQWDPALFLPGLLIFLVAQLIYIAAFLSVTKRGSWVRLLPFAAWGLIAFLILEPLPERSAAAGGRLHDRHRGHDVACSGAARRAGQITGL